MTFELNLDKDVGHFFSFSSSSFSIRPALFLEKRWRKAAGRELDVIKSVQLCHKRSVCGGGEKKRRVHGCVSFGVQGPACCAMNLSTSHRLFFFFEIYLVFICVGMLPTCVSTHYVCLHTTCVKHSWSP